jgi:hypothetical protein
MPHQELREGPVVSHRGCLTTSRPSVLSPLQEGKTYASQQDFFLGFFYQRVGENQRHGTALAPCDER